MVKGCYSTSQKGGGRSGTARDRLNKWRADLEHLSRSKQRDVVMRARKIEIDTLTNARE